MARRKLAAAATLDEIGEALCIAIDSLGRESCPNCGQRTLSFEASMRSGIRVVCEGLDPHGESGACAFEAFTLLSSERELPRADLSVVAAAPVEIPVKAATDKAP